MIKSGLYVPTPAMPMPDLAVPYAAPMQPKIIYRRSLLGECFVYAGELTYCESNACLHNCKLQMLKHSRG